MTDNNMIEKFRDTGEIFKRVAVSRNKFIFAVVDWFHEEYDPDELLGSCGVLDGSINYISVVDKMIDSYTYCLMSIEEFDFRVDMLYDRWTKGNIFKP